MMKIRPGRFTDQDTLIDIWLRSVRASHLFLTEKDIQSLLPAVVDFLALPGLELWVLCTTSDRPVGFMGLAGAVVDALFLAPEHWRQGGGTLLLEHARHLKGPLVVDVNEQNLMAFEFYLTRGFKVAGRSPVDGGGRPFPLMHLREARSTPAPENDSPLT
jgi:putative acetyltransferase